MSNVAALARRPAFLIKLIELVLGAVCVGLMHDLGLFVASGDYSKVQLVHGVYIGFLIISCVTILSYVLEAPIHRTLLIVISLTAGILYITAGAFNLEAYDKGRSRYDKLLGCGICAIINGVVFLLDVFLSYRDSV